MAAAARPSSHVLRGRMSGADNAFATYLFQLERQFYREPTAGFKQRLEALMALTAL